ncbi:tetratricopeptide repeat protein [Peristeroidobacter agariperforans]|uniref:tetratricopeptide repeat protein n=1 Tax=Peristeroidobacter agariperforans TaxID=268404 RepID=UPI00101D65A4|nr:tetratricopeptide repeat protein [Peristeroidobacter agariperforans]
MQTFSVQDVERVLRLSRSTIRGLIKTGFVQPSRGPKRQLLFSFQDLIVLRAARALLEAKISRRRINRSLEDLRRHLPEQMPLSGLSISAVGDRVVVRDGKNHFQVDDGQYVLGLDVSVENGVIRVVEHKEPAAEAPPAETADDWFDKALSLEDSDLKAAQAAYERAVELEPDYVGAWINLGRLLHSRRDEKKAEIVYRRGLQECGANPVLMFNLGVVLEDLGKIDDAIEAYQAALSEDPNMADGHFNLARLYEAQGKEQHAIRHLGQYRRLVSTSDSR